MAKDYVSIYCPHCREHTSLTMATVGYDGYSNEKCIWKSEHDDCWWIGLCNSCDQPVLVHNEGDVIYPYDLPSPSDENIPEEIRMDFDESKLCFSVGAYRACAVMARRALQLSCKSMGSTKDKLVDQIKELNDNGIITKDLKEWADVVRWVGNDAAHPNKDDVKMDDAEDILKLAEQFFNVIFVAPAIAKDRKCKRGK